MNLKEIEEEFGFLREMSSPTREGQAIVSLMSIVKELEISAEVDRDLVGAVDSLSEENTKLKAELEKYKGSFQKTFPSMSLRNDQLEAALKIADEALIWLDDYITQNYGGMKYMQERITEFRQKIKETLGEE